MKRQLIQLTAAVVYVGAIVDASSTFSAEPTNGVDIFIDACRWQGMNPTLIRSADAQFVVTVDSQPPSETAIRTRTANTIKAIEDRIAASSDERTRAHLKQTLAKVPETYRTVMLDQAHRVSRIRVLMVDSDPSGLRKFEVQTMESTTKQWSKPLVALRQLLGQPDGESLLWDPSINTATLNGLPVAVPDFTPIGRMQGEPARLATLALLGDSDPRQFQFSRDRVAAFTNEVQRIKDTGALLPYELVSKTIDGAVAEYLIETSIKHSETGQRLVVQRYVIDPSRGYICPLIQLFGPEGKPIHEWKSSDYFLHDKSGLWFPHNHWEIAFDPVTGQKLTETHFSVDSKSLSINEPIATEQFTVSLPAGAALIDARGGGTESFRTTVPVSFTIGNGPLQLPISDGVELVEDDTAPQLKGGTRTWYRHLFLSANIIIVALILGLVFYFRRRRTVIHRLIVVATSICMFGGCSERDDALLRNDQSAIVHDVELPLSVDFGRVRETDASITRSITLLNRSSHPQHISRVSASCNCTSSQMLTTTLSPGLPLEVPVSLTVAGRVGPIKSTLAIYLRGVSSPLLVSLHATVVRDFWLAGQPVTLSFGTRETVRTGVFDIATHDWPDVVISPISKANALSVIYGGRLTYGRETRVRFEVTATLDSTCNYAQHIVTLTPLHSDLLPLDIPVTCLRGNSTLTSSASSEISLSPKLITVGVIHNRDAVRVKLFASPDVLRTLDIAGLSPALSERLTLALDPWNGLHNAARDYRLLNVRVRAGSTLGLFSGDITFTSGDGEVGLHLSGVIN